MKLNDKLTHNWVYYKVARISYFNNKITYYLTSPWIPGERWYDLKEIMTYKKVWFLKYYFNYIKTKIYDSIT